MEDKVFVEIIEDLLKGLTKGIGGEDKMDPGSKDPIDYGLQTEDLQRFKTWLSLALRFTDVWSEGISVVPEDAVFRSAVGKTHSRLLKALSMFTDKELLNLFGPERANQIRGIANEATFETVTVRAVSPHSSAEPA